MVSLDEFRGEIYLHYIIGKKKLREVMAILERNYQTHFSQKQYKTKLAEWGYYRNTRRCDVISILRQRCRRRQQGKESTFYSHQRPVRMQDIERYQRRYGIQVVEGNGATESEQRIMGQILCRTPPPIMQSLQVPDSEVFPERFLYCLDGLIRGSFESGAWRFYDKDRLIESSSEAAVEQKRIMSFLGRITIGCTAFRKGDGMSAGLRWRQAFVEVEYLIKGRYHDIVPNIFSKVRDLHDWGFPELAEKLMTHITSLCLGPQSSKRPLYSVLRHLKVINLNRLSRLEDQVWEMFRSIFALYVGSECYNTFVMMMDGAKRKLWSSEKDDIDQSLPLLSQLDRDFGPLNCRPMDFLRLRIEILYHRRQFERVLQEAPLMIERANAKVDDPWQRHYFLIKALYHAGSAHFHLGNRASSEQSFEFALYLDSEFCKIDGTDQFRSEKQSMREKLALLRVVDLQ